MTSPLPRLREWISRLQGTILRGRDDRDLEAELQSHLEMAAEDARRCADRFDDAIRAAQLRFGSVVQSLDTLRDQRGLPWLADLLVDLRQGSRVLVKSPGFTIAALLTLALGIGATTTIFGVVNGVLINPLPYPDSDALVRIVHSVGGINQPYFSDAIYASYADNTQAFQDVGVWSSSVSATVTGQGDPEEVRTLKATRGVLTTLGVRPAIGRWFSLADDTPGAPDVVILSHAYWLRRFGGDRAVVERVVSIDKRPHQIVGVMPAGFRFYGEPDLLLPLRVDRGRLIPAFRLQGVARLKPGATLAQANADAGRALHAWFEKFGVNPAVRPRWAPILRPLKEDVVGDVGKTLWVLMAAITIVLGMACVNVANLLLVRADARQREFAIRMALGARWTRVTRQLLAENVMLAIVGGVLGIAMAYGGLRMLLALGPSNLPRLDEVSLSPVVLGFALTISLMTGLLFGLFPILRFAKPRRVDLVGSSRSGTLTRERRRSQSVLVTVQVALALVLLVSAGLMIRSFRALHRVNAGFTEPHNVQTFSISLPATLILDPERVLRMQQQILDNIAAIPGVASAAFATRLPMGSDRRSAALTAEGRADDGRTPPNRQVKIISPGMFHTLGIALVMGRDFTWPELVESRHVAIVSENLAKELWGSPEAALGKRVREYYSAQSPWRQIIGVAVDVYDDGATQPPPSTIYWPAQPKEQFLGLAGYQARRVSFIVRTPLAGTEAVLEQMHQAVWAVSADLPLSEVRTLDDVYGQSMVRTAFTLTMLAIASAMALLLGLLGLYAVIAYAVSQRQREIGIRLALGAQAHQIRSLFVRRSLVVVALGVGIGLAGAVGFTRFMQSLIFGVNPFDPTTFAAMSVVVSVAAVTAGYLPTRRAAAVDPIATLRMD